MFADLAALGAKLRLDEPALDTHRALVEADILVMSKGAFSYTAGVLNEGITLYDPQKYRPLQGWVVRAPDGSFDEALSPAAWRSCSAQRLSSRRRTNKNRPSVSPGGFRMNIERGDE